MTAQQIIDALPFKGFDTRKQYNAYVKRQIVKAGYTPVKAVYDKAGNCVICGEAGRCPGYHTQDETHNHKWVQTGFDLLGSPANPDEPNERVYYKCETCGATRVTLERAGVVLKETVTPAEHAS